MRKATRLFGRWKRREKVTTMRVLESITKAGLQYGIKARKQCEGQSDVGKQECKMSSRACGEENGRVVRKGGGSI